MIEVTGLVKKYGDQLAVDQLSFTLESGRIYGLLGANGAGKSTTMNIITGYLGAAAGDVVINGKNILDEPEAAKRQIGYLPETPPLYPEMKVTEYLQFAMGLKGLHKERIAPHLQELLEKVQLEDVKDRLIRNLSKGYKQRVGLAEALIGWPPIIILDEPTVGLDPQQIIGIRQLITQLGEKHTVILSSHILAEVQEICDHILVIQQGKLIASESTEDLLALMNPSQGLELVVEGEEKQVSDILSSVPNIHKVVFGEMLATTITVRLEVVGEVDLRRDLFFAFAKAGVPILEYGHSQTNLEQAFLELIKDPTPEEGQPA
ncbi:ABC transporter ATP-binding protein [Enterococcus diestrammenae]|uniref:ABC-2 type transport system ATP-binding protein n=1 Tax=Enterococcus diestrammenae TaxID=1155073 RepID=A0ABV0F1H7_9ENTE|nr:ABC transporter ATP-binding protein [Enterococcus diestrammenae]KAF1294819.1 ABC transporter [Enterococcus diestrammenae]